MEPETRYTLDQVTEAANVAADILLELLDSDADEHRDLVNLLVNMTIGYLEMPDTTPESIAESAYNEPLGEVLSWL